MVFPNYSLPAAARGSVLVEERILRVHDSTLLSHLVAAQRADGARHPLRDHLVVDGLHTRKRHHKATAVDRTATPLGVTFGVQVGILRLDERARQTGSMADARLGVRDLVEDVIVVLAVDRCREQDREFRRVRVQHDDAASVLVDDAEVSEWCQARKDHGAPGHLACRLGDASKTHLFPFGLYLHQRRCCRPSVDSYLN